MRRLTASVGASDTTDHTEAIIPTWRSESRTVAVLVDLTMWHNVRACLASRGVLTSTILPHAMDDNGNTNQRIARHVSQILVIAGVF